jgi:membrane-bound serine protease (ClpP class)
VSTLVWLGPNAAFALALAGLLCIYGEFVRPGRILPGTLGAAMLLIGAYSLYRNEAEAAGVVWISAAASLFLLEIFVNSFFIAGALGTAALGYGSWRLIPGPISIFPSFSIPLSMLFGAATMFLTDSARQARINKRADL